MEKIAAYLEDSSQSSLQIQYIIKSTKFTLELTRQLLDLKSMGDRTFKCNATKCKREMKENKYAYNY